MTLKDSPDNKFIIAFSGKSDDYKMMSDFHHCLGPWQHCCIFVWKHIISDVFLPIVHTKTTKNAAEKEGLQKGDKQFQLLKVLV